LLKAQADSNMCAFIRDFKSRNEPNHSNTRAVIMDKKGSYSKWRLQWSLEKGKGDMTHPSPTAPPFFQSTERWNFLRRTQSLWTAIPLLCKH